MRLPIDSGDPGSAPGDYGFFSFEGHGVFLSVLPILGPDQGDYNCPLVLKVDRAGSVIEIAMSLD